MPEIGSFQNSQNQSLYLSMDSKGNPLWEEFGSRFWRDLGSSIGLVDSVDVCCARKSCEVFKSFKFLYGSEPKNLTLFSEKEFTYLDSSEKTLDALSKKTDFIFWNVLKKIGSWLCFFIPIISHKDLLEIASVRMDGCCHGVSLMGMQAVLSETEDLFDERLKKLASLINLCKKQGIKLSDIRQFIKNPDLLAFLEGVKLGQEVCTSTVAELFTKETKPKDQRSAESCKRIFSLIASLELEKKGFLMDVASFSGVYTRNEFACYFSSLEKIIKEGPAPKTPISFVLENPTHAINIGYNPKKESWFFIDANRISLRKLKAEELAQYVRTAFAYCVQGSSDGIPMCTTAYIANRKTDPEVSLWQAKMEDWKNSEKMKEMHVISENDSRNIRHLRVVSSDEVALQIVRGLIERKVNLNEEFNGSTPLISVLCRKCPGAARELIRAGVDLNRKDEKGHTALERSILTEDIEILKELIKAGADVNEKGANGLSLLGMACFSGHVEIVKELIKSGSDVKEKNLLTSTLKRRHVEVVKELIKAGVDVNEKDSEGFTALILASAYGDVDIVKELIKARACVNDSEGFTALTIASSKGRLDIVKELIKAKVNGFMGMREGKVGA